MSDTDINMILQSIEVDSTKQNVTSKVRFFPKWKNIPTRTFEE